MRRPVVVALVGLACLVLAGPGAAARILVWAGLPGAAALLSGAISDPATRGLVFYRAGRYAEADAALEAAGRGQTFNRALTLAATGRHALSVAYLDAVLFANPADAEAARVRDMVLAFVPPVVGESTAPGRLAARGGLLTTAPVGADGSPSTPDPEWQKPHEQRGYAASDAWLETIADDPGTFLRLRLEKEFERRAALGLARPEEGDPW